MGSVRPALAAGGHAVHTPSSPGMTEARTERIARLVYLDAFVPEDGRSAFDTRPDLEAALRRRAVDGLIPPLDPWFRRRRSAWERG